MLSGKDELWLKLMLPPQRIAGRKSKTALHRTDAHGNDLNHIAVFPQPGDDAMNPRRIIELVLEDQITGCGEGWRL